MKHAGTVLVAALCAVAAVLWWRHGSEHAQPADAGEPTRASAPAASEDAPVVTQEADPPQVQDASSSVTHEDYAAQLRAAPDYLEFVRSLLSAARAGDHAAQFYIYRALEYCDDGDRGYFKGRGGRKTLDEALKWASTRWPRDSEEILRVHARCHTLMETDAKDLGERGEWLWLAADGGYPRAQVIAAYRPFSNGGAVKREEPQSLLAKAIRSRDPEVIWEIGNLPLELRPADGGQDSDSAAWWLAACGRGFDCSPKTQVVWYLCRFDPNCQPYESVPDLIRRWAGNELPEIEARARWINEKIDAGDWEALGFGL